jgi:hypothetical protein
LHCKFRALSRAFITAGKSSPISMPMMEITTSNSTSVKPPILLRSISILLDLAACDLTPSIVSDDCK